MRYRVGLGGANVLFEGRKVLAEKAPDSVEYLLD